MPSRRIQIVDGDPTAALVTQRGLQRLLNNDAEVTIAASPEAALRACAQHLVELLIVDPSPQSVVVTTMLKSVRERYPDLPILILTAYDSPLLRRQMRGMGIQHYVAKPVTLHDLSDVVRSTFGMMSLPTVTPTPEPLPPDDTDHVFLRNHVHVSQNG